MSRRKRRSCLGEIACFQVADVAGLLGAAVDGGDDARQRNVGRKHKNKSIAVAPPTPDD